MCTRVITSKKVRVQYSRERYETRSHLRFRIRDSAKYDSACDTRKYYNEANVG